MKIDMPLTFIGDMPRQLVSCGNWRCIEIPIEDIQCGDLLFTKNKSAPKLLSHVALAIKTNQIFHCCPSIGTAIIQSEEEFFSLYEQRLNFEQMIRYIDPRNKVLRSMHKGIFIPLLQDAQCHL